MRRHHFALGLPRGVVRLAAPDPNWPGAFQSEAERLGAFVRSSGLPTLVFEHIGSTAVAGMIAKPIIDFMAGYTAGVDRQSYVDVLLNAGYEWRGPQGVPERELLVFGPETARTYHLNVVEANGPFWQRHLAFRNRLRGDPDIAAAYAALKQALAARHANERGAYTAGKAGFVQQVSEG